MTEGRQTHIYHGLWYPVVVPLMTVVADFLFALDRKDVDLHE